MLVWLGSHHKATTLQRSSSQVCIFHFIDPRKLYHLALLLSMYLLANENHIRNTCQAISPMTSWNRRIHDKNCAVCEEQFLLMLQGYNTSKSAFEWTIIQKMVRPTFSHLNDRKSERMVHGSQDLSCNRLAKLWAKHCSSLSAYPCNKLFTRVYHIF